MTKPQYFIWIFMNSIELIIAACIDCYLIKYQAKEK